MLHNTKSKKFYSLAGFKIWISNLDENSFLDILDAIENERQKRESDGLKLIDEKRAFSTTLPKR